MSDSLHSLVKDTLSFIASQYDAEATLFSTPELVCFFETPPPPAVKELPPQVEKQLLKPITLGPPATKELPPQVEKKMAGPIALSPPAQSSTLPTSGWQEIIAAALPQFRLKEEAVQNLAEVAVLAYEESAEGLQFVKNLAAAINKELCRTKLIDARGLEREKRWDLFLKPGAFRWILFSSSLLEKAPALKNYYKKNPSAESCFLGEIPAYIFAPSSHYLKDPSQKALLWKSLCQLLKK
jgi:hypothetical protein